MLCSVWAPTPARYECAATRRPRRELNVRERPISGPVLPRDCPEDHGRLAAFETQPVILFEFPGLGEGGDG